MPFVKGEQRPKAAGRRAGTPNKRPSRAACWEIAEQAGVNPFQVLIDLCKHPDPNYRLGAAKEACRYLYKTETALDVSLPKIEVETKHDLRLVAELKDILNNQLSELKPRQTARSLPAKKPTNE